MRIVEIVYVHLGLESMLLVILCWTFVQFLEQDTFESYGIVFIDKDHRNTAQNTVETSNITHEIQEIVSLPLILIQCEWCLDLDA